MYQVLIVDDEPIEVQSVEFVIRNNFIDLKVAGTARSGRSAIEKSESLRPDIVLMDINMPGINGLDAMRQIRLVNPTVRFLVVSAFNYFSYAQESVTLGVDEYLLKPVKEEKLVDSLHKVTQRIDIQRQKVRRELELREKFELVMPVLETGFINTICMPDGHAEDLRKYCRLFGFQKTGGYVLAIRFSFPNGVVTGNQIGICIKSQKLYGRYREILKNLCTCIVGPVALGNLVVYVLDSRGPSKEQKFFAVETAQKFFHQAENLGLSIAIGVGGYCADVSGAQASYRQALDALDQISELKNQVHILHYQDIMEEGAGRFSYGGHEFVQDVCLRADAGDTDGAILAFSALFQDKTRSMDIEELKNCCISLFIKFDHKWGNWIKGYTPALEKVILAKTREELKVIGSRFITKAVRCIVENKQKKAGDIVAKADAYMEAKFNGDITLGSIAKAVNLSPYYFSHFYKEKTGINFIDHLISIRIERAKQILSTSDVSVKDVARQVGYADPSYFSRLFKQITGVTATEYKDHYGK